MIRALWWLALAGVAAVTVMAEVDRASARHPELAAFVPAPFRGFAQPTVAMLSLAAGRTAAAREESRALVRRRPIPAENLYALALANLAAGDTVGYARAFEVATTRGWRAVPIQIDAAQSAIAHGDASAAALRIAAAWAVDAQNPALPELVAELAALPGGAQALGEAVAKTRIAPGRFVAVVTATTDGETRSRIFTAARRAGMEIDTP